MTTAPLSNDTLRSLADEYDKAALDARGLEARQARLGWNLQRTMDAAKLAERCELLAVVCRELLELRGRVSEQW